MKSATAGPGYNERLFSGGVRRHLHLARFKWLARAVAKHSTLYKTVLESGVLTERRLISCRRLLSASAEPVNCWSVFDQLRVDNASHLLEHVADGDASFSGGVTGLSVRNSNPPDFNRRLFSSLVTHLISILFLLPRVFLPG